MGDEIIVRKISNYRLPMPRGQYSGFQALCLAIFFNVP